MSDQLESKKKKKNEDIIMWIKNFLTDRSFQVKVNNILSNVFPIGAGVPQGAVLSPVLFSIFINDMPCKYEKNSKYSLLFADDLVASFIFKKHSRVNKTINTYLKQIEIWLCKWRLVMAPTKCSYLIFKKPNSTEP
jgi:hypothetical protein